MLGNKHVVTHLGRQTAFLVSREKEMPVFLLRVEWGRSSAIGWSEDRAEPLAADRVGLAQCGDCDARGSNGKPRPGRLAFTFRDVDRSAWACLDGPSVHENSDWSRYAGGAESARGYSAGRVQVARSAIQELCPSSSAK